MDEHTMINQRLWNELAPLHAGSSFYDVASFLHGMSTLGDVETAELGDVAGRRLVHLMCHFGLDSLSLARAGAHVTGVDFSSKAIHIAQDLSTQIGVDAQFVCCDVMDAADYLADEFDIVFLSNGILVWIEDVSTWANVCARLLQPGGVFYLLDLHPLANALTRTEEGVVVHGHYFHALEPTVVVKDGSYAVSDVGLEHQESREWSHSLGDVVTALSQAGIRIEFLHEFPEADGTGGEQIRHPLPARFSIRGIRE